MADRKTYVLDTSVLLSSPNALWAFEEHLVVIPLVVVTELEGKRDHPELGHLARKALRNLEQLRLTPDADLKHGVQVNEKGGVVRVEVNHVDQKHLPDALKHSRTHDVRILAVAKNLSEEHHDVVVVSKDMPMRIHADILGLRAEEYRNEQVRVDEGYTGIEEVQVGSSVIDDLYENKRIDFEFDGLHHNQGFVLVSGRNRALARVTAITGPNTGELTMVQHKQRAWDLEARSDEQKIAMAHLLDKDIPIVSLGGPAGTGKSLLALTAAAEEVMEKRHQKRIIVFRPLFAVGGQDLGFLPGTEAEKMGPWGAAVFDALRVVTSEIAINEMLAAGKLEILPLTHIRGRTFTDAVVVIDFISHRCSVRDVRQTRRVFPSRTPFDLTVRDKAESIKGPVRRSPGIGSRRGLGESVVERKRSSAVRGAVHRPQARRANVGDSGLRHSVAA